MSKNPRGKSPLASVQGADRTRTILIQVGVGAVLVALIAAIGISVAVKQAKKNDPGPTPTVAAQQAAPDALTASITDNGAIRIGKPGAKATVRVVADLQCPACQAFEQANGKAIEDEVASGKAVVEYNIIAFLDKMSSGTRYSSRGANAAYCVAGADPAKFLPWLTTMYQQQPPENGTGLSNDRIVQIAQAAGYTDPAVAECITSDKYDKYVQKVTKDVLGEGIQSTPSVFVNGTAVKSSQELMQPDGLRQTIENAAK
ncbi:DsbA family protein [Nocardia blacklockiae]|uniref:DsbA family protein n=1 Tax=Nocardia blacklockiae TaxID=480036 RepID=UPI001895F42E|nr:thioredoxin domain-containing protein [Nocardia blacklockiae]MBF6172946.1 thioredoxin domain-containing protein [Nocardia blacklockiae]